MFLPARNKNGGPLELANFVLVPFSNRIAEGSFEFADQSINVPPTYAPASSRHAIHGHGWTAAWDVVAKTDETLHLHYHHAADSWPWDYLSEQKMTLTADGYVHHLSITNQSPTDMPAGLGFHPYFPREGAQLRTIFDGLWDVTDDGLPIEWIAKTGPYDLSADDPADTIFTGRKTAHHIDWPGYRLTMTPDADLPETHIYAPTGEDYFCVEPVSHMTDAINRDGLNILAPGESWSTQIIFAVTPKNQLG